MYGKRGRAREIRFFDYFVSGKREVGRNKHFELKGEINGWLDTIFFLSLSKAFCKKDRGAGTKRRFGLF